jgi:D-alanyl-lipoteichoic acid acyltransferase DltB (MBOAT superfamily)
MAFNSYTFIIFLGIVLLLHYSPFGWRIKKFNLLIASYLFYMAWNPPFVILLWICSIVDWLAAKRMYDAISNWERRVFLIISLVVNLGMLSFFKYGNFLLDNFVWLLSTIHIKYQPAMPDIILPLGISFFTFQSLTYSFDIYRGKEKPWHSFLDYALFVSFFPKVTIGPITRAFDFLRQCESPRKADSSDMSWGFILLLVGLFEKIVIADAILAPIADQIFEKTSGVPNFLSAWTGTLAFTGQIFCDFAGYSSCAIGIALCLGFQLPINFKFPYAAIGFSDFWRRWHISLSSWLRDYLYISMGGNRRGTFRTHINLMLTMLLGGLWHGASWTFVAWGGLHGLYLVFERLVKKLIPESPVWSTLPVRFFLAIITFILVCIAWVFFRAKSFDHAFVILQSMLILNSGTPAVNIEPVYILTTAVVMSAMLIIHWIMRDISLKDVVENMSWWQRSFALAILLVIIITCSGEDRAFIYFQF